MSGGGNPIWHAMNLEKGILPSYIQSYGLDPANDPQDKLTGKYVRYYDKVSVAPWLWNAEKKVFLSTEDAESIKTKADYVANQGLGGVMIWELAGDYGWYPERNGGEFYIGTTMTSTLYDSLKNAPAYGNKLAERAMPAKAVDIAVTISGFKVGDQNYPINPKVQFKNNTGVDIPGGTEFQFDIPTSSPANAADQSGAGLKVIQAGHTGDNIGGLKGNFHRVAFTPPSWKTLAKGETYDLDIVYYLPITGPANYTVKINGTEYAFATEYPNLPLADLSAGNGSGGGTGGGTATDSCSSKNVDVSKVKVYPNWTQMASPPAVTRWPTRTRSTKPTGGLTPFLVATAAGASSAAINCARNSLNPELPDRPARPIGPPRRSIIGRLTLLRRPVPPFL
ncbi:chitinase C-terminal domain-containing protein [Plesiomonas shigelloides subsp. oncorhynchi]|nr:chitinase C-terminal domain-containing protein [Plesiomonas shigelloides]